MYIFASKDFNQAYLRLKYMQQIASYRERQAAYITGTQKELGQKIVELDKNKEDKKALLEDQEKAEKVLSEVKNAQTKVVADLSKHQKEIKQEQADTQRKLSKINRAVADAVRRELEEERRREEEAAKAEAARARAENRPVTAKAKPRTTSELLNATPEAAKLSSDFLGNKGRLPWPVANGVVTHPYGVFYTNGIKDENKGINIKTNANASVRAVFDGDVFLVQDIEGTYLVIIRHGLYLTVYSGLRTVTVSKGQKVTTKQGIGTAATDNATGETEIGFEVHKGMDDMNPALWLTPNN
jgi:septal ring factor EnvC (AmiA/AmiB activator)